MKRFVKYNLIAVIFISFLILGIRESKILTIKNILTQNMWYISSALKKDGTSIEASNDLSYIIFDFNENNSYKVYQSLFPKYEFASLYYYGNESFKVKIDSLLFVDYIKFKFVKVTKDSIVLEYFKTYSTYSVTTDNYTNVYSDSLIYTLKPIFINPVPDSTYGRSDHSFSKPTIID